MHIQFNDIHRYIIKLLCMLKNDLLCNFVLIQLLRERNWKAMDALNKSEQLMTERIEQSVKVVKVNFPTGW